MAVSQAIPVQHRTPLIRLLLAYAIGSPRVVRIPPRSHISCSFAQIHLGLVTESVRTRWSDSDRERFWTFVRGRIGEQRLSQERVAQALGIDHANLSRRLRGQTKARPDRHMAEQLASILRLSDAEREIFDSLLTDATLAAGSRVQAHFSAAVTPKATEPVRSKRRSVGPKPDRSFRRALVLATVGLASAAALAAALTSWVANDRERSQPTRPGGIWVSPRAEQGFTTTVPFAARAYPSARTDPPIEAVEFTVSWEGRPGPWIVACRVTAPSANDVYECAFDGIAAIVPTGKAQVSFDVYDSAGNVNRAPHGTRIVNIARS